MICNLYSEQMFVQTIFLKNNKIINWIRMKGQILLAVLILTCLADDQVITNCFPCQVARICVSYSGGGFGDGTTFLTTAQSCAEMGNFPFTLDFICGSDCNEGCLISVSAPG